jgi:methylaspartate ammonia-lyase
MPARTIGIGFEVDKAWHWGDGMSVQYAGAGGRDAPLSPDAVLPVLRAASWTGIDVRRFRDADAEARARLNECGIQHTAIHYAVSQALLRAAAAATGVTMAEVLCAEYGLELVAAPVPIYSQSGDDRHASVEKMLSKRVGVLPHGLINTSEKFAGLLDYVAWVRDRALAYDHRPTLHFDLYGLAGRVLGSDPRGLADFLERLEAAARPLKLRIESPVDLGSRAAQLAGLAALRAEVDARGLAVELVADEWCNTLDDMRAFAARRAGHMVQVKVPDLGSIDATMQALAVCGEHGMAAFLGGSCTETDLSAQVCVHIALATRPAFLLAKPGMGVDEGLMIVHNEQQRLLAQLSARR